ncbi:MAG: rhomboid family intramembrane serine protease, partial [Myxococcales bacterium]|nr:rhomboid family intramembrane serine protease [Myxococcales bacterium]
DTCPVCFGVWFDQEEIDALGDVDIDPAFLKTLVGTSANRMCPRGHGFMNEHVIPELLKTPIDRCPVCRGLWLDGDERKALARSSTREGQEDRKVALAKRGLIWAAQILTALPVEVENPARGTPWVVYSISGILSACYIASVFGIVYARELALIPGAVVRHPAELYKLFTHIFFHADWFHLLGNLYFFYTFGDNVEHIYGHRRFVALFLIAGVLGGLAQVLLTHATATPVIGASGAIAGVMGAYVILFPRARILMLIPIFVYPLFVEVPAPALIFGWFGLQLYEGTASLSMHDHAATIAWWAHVGGFAVGALVALLMRGRAHRTPLMDDEGGAPEASGRLS